MTFVNDVKLFNRACFALEVEAGVQDYWEILELPDNYTQRHVEQAEYLDDWDCYLLQREEA